MVDFVRLVRAARDAAVAGGAPPRYAAKIGAFLGSLNIWFWALVGLPTLIAGVYYFALASDLYLSEVKFVVRGRLVGWRRHVCGARIPDGPRRGAAARAGRRSAQLAGPAGGGSDHPLPRG